jgi:hypothetical protein
VVPDGIAQHAAISRAFTAGNKAVIIAENQPLELSAETRSARRIRLDPPETGVGRIRDVSSFDGTLFVRTGHGLYAVDIERGSTIEAVTLHDESLAAGCIAADYDYLWHATPDTLWRFDRLGREWQGYAAPPRVRDQKLTGCSFDGDQVYCYSREVAAVFSAYDEQWRTYPVPRRPLRDHAFYVQSAPAGLILDGDRALRFQPADQSFQEYRLPAAPVDIDLQGAKLYFATAEGAFVLDFDAGLIQELSIGPAAGIAAIARVSESLIALALDDYLLLYDPVEGAASQAPYPGSFSDAPLDIVSFDNMLSIVGRTAVAWYDRQTRLWETAAARGDQPVSRGFEWDDAGCAVRFGTRASSTLSGDIEYSYPLWDTVSIELDSQWTRIRRIDTAGDTIHEWGWAVSADTLSAIGVRPLHRIAPRANLALHTRFARERYLDLFFDNTSPADIARKGASYQGARTDRLEAAHAGDVALAIPGLQTIPGVRAQGISARGGSRRRLTARDRRIARISAGAGFRQNRSIRQALAYRPDGVYRVGGTRVAPSDVAGGAIDTTRIAPGSLKLSVDGERVDSSAFTFIASTGRLLVNRPDLIDPFSVITVSYDVETIPDSGLETIELLPSNHFGKTGYATALLSPAPWLGARASYATVVSGGRRDLASVALPAELRADNLLLKLLPEATWDPRQRTGAAGLDATSRIGPAAFSVRGLIADSAFVSTDTLSRGYGAITADIETSGEIDIVPALAVHSAYRATRARRGVESRYSAGFDVTPRDLPGFSVILSRSAIDAAVSIAAPPVNDTADTTVSPLTDTAPAPADSQSDASRIDTLDRLTTRVRARVYETNSALVEQRLGLHRASYEFALTEYLARDRDERDAGRGGSVFGEASLSPIAAVTVTGTGSHQRNPAGAHSTKRTSGEIRLQTIDAPSGADIRARYAIEADVRPSAAGASVATIRSVTVLASPGAWVDWARWFSPRLGLEQTLVNDYPGALPSAARLVRAAHHRSRASLAKTAGLQIAPTFDILFLTQHTWTDNLFQRDRYSGLTDLRIYLRGKRDLLQARYELTARIDSLDNHSASVNYDRTWFPWLTAQLGAAAALQSGSAPRELRAGPNARVRIGATDRAFFKRIRHDQTVTLAWRHSRGKWANDAPSVTHATYLRLLIVPNISLVGASAFTWTARASTEYAVETFNLRFTLGAHF